MQLKILSDNEYEHNKFDIRYKLMNWDFKNVLAYQNYTLYTCFPPILMEFVLFTIYVINMHVCWINPINWGTKPSFPFLNTPIKDFLHVFPYWNYSYLLWLSLS